MLNVGKRILVQVTEALCILGGFFLSIFVNSCFFQALKRARECYRFKMNSKEAFDEFL